ncbi:hypothetical protein OG225_40370 (plasmid) [Nocardia sp. NBC_01377]|uniref:hypothetical protein n=1 Tax=Nocardia sp. NBC_01377 TaxID=2903595 RepID=UPI002F91879B
MTLLTRTLALAAVALTLILGSAGMASAQPTTTPTPAPAPAQEDSTTYGFDETCNQIHDALSDIPVIGTWAGNTNALGCKLGNAATHPGSAVDATTAKLWDSTFGKVTETLMDGLAEALSLSMLWIKSPNDVLLEGAGPDASESTLWGRVDSYTRQLQTWVLAFSIAISALRIGIARAQAAAEHAEETFKMLARSTMTTWVAGAAILAAARMTDDLSAWIITDATGGDAEGAAKLMFDTGRFGVYGPGFMFLVAIVGMLGALAMFVLTILRQALLVVAVGFYPLTAAASGTSSGKQAYERLGAWIIAFLLFKPVAALVYMIAFVTADATANDPGTEGVYSLDAAHRSFVALVLLCSAAFVLPALIRLVAPALSVLGSGGSGAGAAAALAGIGVTAAAAGIGMVGARGATTGAGTAGQVPATGTRAAPATGARQLPALGGGNPSRGGLPPGAGAPGSGGVVVAGQSRQPASRAGGVASATVAGGVQRAGTESVRTADDAAGGPPALPPGQRQLPRGPSGTDGPHRIDR